MTDADIRFYFDPGVPVRLDHQQVGAHGRGSAGLRRRLAVHLPAEPAGVADALDDTR